MKSPARYSWPAFLRMARNRITLMAIDDKMMFNAESAATMRELVKAGTFGFAVFECDDMLATYEELKAKGVHFKKGPTKEF